MRVCGPDSCFSSGLQLQMIEQDINPEKIRRECILFLRGEEEQDDVQTGSRHIIEFVDRVISEIQE